MSFILDALKKSENERQAQADVEFATVPVSAGEAAVPRWLWVLGALLLINIVVLTGLVLRPDTPVMTPQESLTNIATPPVTTAEPAVAPAASFAERVDAARAERPEPATATVAAPAPVVEPVREAAPAYLPDMTELILDGSLSLPPLHVDIHVYSDQPSERFVFINMNKYREGQTLSEGPALREITQDGVVLDYRGTAFVLPRE